MSSNKVYWAGWVLSGLFAIFMLGASALPKLAAMPVAGDMLRQLGWAPGNAFGIGVLELVLTVLYLYPRTRYLAAILLTALMGGAIATQLRVGSPLFSHVLFGVYLGVTLWGGLWLRDWRLRALMPWSADQDAPSNR